MAIPHPPRPKGYGNHDLTPRWQVGDFKVGDVIECFQCLNGVMQPSKPDCGIIFGVYTIHYNHNYSICTPLCANIIIVT